MIIRSQDKKSIVNLDNTFEISTHDKKVVVSGSYTADGLLGTYSTEEKAIKVLDMIEKSYVESVWTDLQMIIANRICFEMPQDSEV